MACRVSYRYLGSSGLKISNICLGTLTFGENQDGRPGQCDEPLAHAILDRFVECGGNFIDTADIYQNGLSEEIIGNWMIKQKRDEVVLATKVRFNPNSSSPNDSGLSRGRIMTAVDESLRRLQTSYIDLYQMHCWDSAVPIEETLKALNDLVVAGKVRYLGASNVTGWQMQKIADLCKQHNYAPIVSLQQQYSLLARHLEYELSDVCRQEGIGILPWSPLKGGLLSGKYKRYATELPSDTRLGFVQNVPHVKSWSHPDFKQFKNDEKLWKILDVVEKIAKEQNKSVPQVALRWLLQRDTVSSVVIGAKTFQQLEDNLGSSEGWELTKKQMEDLDEASAIDQIYPYDFITTVNRRRQRNNVCQ